MTLSEMKLAILTTLDKLSHHHEHKSSLIGLPYSRGHVEAELDITFDQAQRALASEAFEDLKRNGLIEPTYHDPNAPELWVRITTRGKQAASDGLLDDLDKALASLDPKFVELRAGAWSVVASGQPDAARQAAHSGRELIEQVLRTGAPDQEVRQQPGFVPHPSVQSGITRRHRVELMVSRLCEHNQELAQSACDLLLTAHRRLTAISHAPRQLPAERAREALTIMEAGLRVVLLGEDAADS